VPRPSGLGRGLAAILPDAVLPMRPAHIERLDHGARPMTMLSAALSNEMSGTESGIALIYCALDALVAEFGLDDAAVVIDEATLGRQVFRSGRRPLDEDDEVLLTASPGLYTEPVLDDGSFDRTLVYSFCVLALRLDVLRYDAWHDPLTGIFDRRSFDRLLEMSVARSTRYGWPFTLVIMDLDGFKDLNDREGHMAGDAILRDLGERLHRALRFGDHAARIGGDEFAMILPNTEADLVPALIERIRAVSGLATATPRFSYGIAQCPTDADDFETLFRLADKRLYEAKEQH